MRYFRRGVSKAVFVPVIANRTRRRVAELTAGTDLSAAVNSITGFTTDTSRISEPVLAYKQNPQADGEQTFGNAAMKLMEDNGVAASTRPLWQPPTPRWPTAHRLHRARAGATRDQEGRGLAGQGRRQQPRLVARQRLREVRRRVRDHRHTEQERDVAA
jgi:hypothetical protein